MKKLLFILLLIPFLGNAQSNPIGNSNTNNYVDGLLNVRNVFNNKLEDTATVKAKFTGQMQYRWAYQGGRLWWNPTGSKFVIMNTADIIDTLSLSNRINQKVGYSDTLAMLLPYATKAKVLADSIALAGQTNLRVKYIDTASMLASYNTRINAKQNTVSLTTTGTSGAATFNATTGALNIPNYATGGAATDTTSLSNRIDQRVKYVDTAAMLTNYARSAQVVKYTDTAALQSSQNTRIDQRVKYTDTASMLANLYTIAASKVKYSDTAAMLANYLRSALGVKYTDTAAMLTNYPTIFNNGLTKSTKTVALGGSLTAATTITTTGSNTLALAGLQSGGTNDSVVTVNPSTGVLARRAFPSGGGGSLTGSGTAKYSAAWTSSSNLTTGSLFDSAGYLGIGTTMTSRIGWLQMGQDATLSIANVKRLNMGGDIGGFPPGYFANCKLPVYYRSDLPDVYAGLCVASNGELDISAWQHVIFTYGLGLTARTVAGGFYLGNLILGTGTSTSYKLDVTGNVKYTNAGSSSAVPTVVAGTGAGAGATIGTIIGTNEGFLVPVTTAGTPAASAVIFTATFSGSFTSTSTGAGVSPAATSSNKNAQQLSGAQAVGIEGTTTGDILYSGPTGLTTGTTYLFYIHNKFKL